MTDMSPATGSGSTYFSIVAPGISICCAPAMPTVNRINIKLKIIVNLIFIFAPFVLWVILFRFFLPILVVKPMNS